MKFKITPLKLIKNEKRGNVFEFNLSKKKNFLFLSIKKGYTRGDHYHLGKSKNPENLFLISGKVRIIFSNPNGKNKKIILVKKPSRIQIWPHTFHSFLAIKDTWLFEANEKKVSSLDTIKTDE